MARPKPLAQGELLTHRDEINNHKHCNENHKFDSNSLTMSPIGEEIYYYKWWNMAMVVERLDLSLFLRRLVGVVDGDLGGG